MRIYAYLVFVWVAFVMNLRAQDTSREPIQQTIEKAQAQVEQQYRLERIRGPDDLPIPPARLPVFFPPEPPALGGTIDTIGPLYMPMWDAPAELAEFVGEAFYAPLGMCYAEQELGRSDRRRLDEFSRMRRLAVEDLRSRLEGRPTTTRSAAPEAVEAMAEELRRRLHSEEFDWNRYRNFRSSSSGDNLSVLKEKLREFQTLRAAVYFVEGLAPAHRRLLHEFTFDLTATSAIADLLAPKAKPGAVIWFLPEMSRLTLPPSLPEDLRAQLDAFLEQKHRLKQEIAVEVLRWDSAMASKAEAALQAFCVKKAAAVAELEVRAESIRTALAALPVPAGSALPPDVIALADKYLAHRDALQADLAARLRSARHELLSYKPGFEQLTWKSQVPLNSYTLVTSESAGVPVAPSWVAETEQQLRRPEAARQRFKKVTDEFASATAERTRTLENEKGELYLATARAIGRSVGSDGKLDSETVQKVVATLQRFALDRRMSKYIDYETAVLRPGLSPSERRLLFNAALVSLKLPLPAAVRRPVGRFED